MLELPGLAGGVGDETADAELVAQIVNPAGQKAGLDYDDRRLLLADPPLQFGASGVEAGEGNVAGGLGVGTGDALVFAEVDGENGGRGRGLRVHRASSVGRR